MTVITRSALELAFSHRNVYQLPTHYLPSFNVQPTCGRHTISLIKDIINLNLILILMSHLPPELVFVILEHAYYTSAGSPDYDLLANCSLVCASWSIPAQTLLFNKTTKLQLDVIALFHAALITSAVRGKPLGHAVRSLTISIGGSLDEACRPEAFAQILQACPRLYELSLSIHSLHEFDHFALAKLKDSGQNIRALNLQSCGVQSPVLFQLLGIWQGIRFLKIGAEIAAWPWRHPAETPVLRQSQTLDNITRRPPAHVTLYDLALSRIPQQAVLIWLLGSSASSLRILDLHESPGVATRQVLGVHAPHLRSLRLLHFNLDSAAFLRQCTGLEELIIYNIPVIVPLAPELPPSIEHFSFRNPRHTSRNTLRPILDALRVLPKLRIVTCDNNSERLRDFEMLKEGCAERGVEVVITEVPFWVYEDPIVVRRFPRQRSVSNFSLMTS